MPLIRIWNFVLLLSLSNTMLFAQNNIGINVDTPSVDLDVRTLSTNDGAEVSVGNMDNSHFARLFSGYPAFPNALLYWKTGYPLILANAEEDGSNYTPHMWVNPDGKVGIGICQQILKDPGSDARNMDIPYALSASARRANRAYCTIWV